MTQVGSVFLTIWPKARDNCIIIKIPNLNHIDILRECGRLFRFSRLSPGPSEHVFLVRPTPTMSSSIVPCMDRDVNECHLRRTEQKTCERSEEVLTRLLQGINLGPACWLNRLITEVIVSNGDGTLGR